jgi:CheY-like chemotaxis protein/GGDEF domain-containing protein
MSNAGTVLVVEDDQAIRRLLNEALSGNGYETVEAADGPTALEAARASTPDVILLDVGLPGTDGFGVLAELKADEQLREVPVLMVTAWGDANLIRRALDRGANGYVRKPFALDELLGAVAVALESGAPGAAVAGDAVDARVEDGTPFTAMLVGVDGLDRVEELHGPVAAAALVAAVGRRLRAAAPGIQVLTRLGRQELLVLAPGDEAEALAQVLCHTVAAGPVDLETVVVRSTVSIGYAAFEGETAGELLERCAEALEQARSSGGDCAQAAAGFVALQAAA